MDDDITSDVYHEGEIAVQQRAGVRERADGVADMVERTVPAGTEHVDLSRINPTRSSRPSIATARCGCRC